MGLEQTSTAGARTAGTPKEACLPEPGDAQAFGPLPDFPVDRPPPCGLPGGSRLLDRALPVSLVRRLRELASRECISLGAVLLAAFQTLLHRYGLQEEFVLPALLGPDDPGGPGDPAPTAPRLRLVRADLSGGASFAEV